MKRKFRELNHIYALEKRVKSKGRVRVLTEISCGNQTFPIHTFQFGTEDKTAPTFVILGGVHGIEKVGTHISLYFLRSFLQQMTWDSNFNLRLKENRIIFIPLVNPGGMYMNRRSNPQGVDLMRNSPVEAIDEVPFLVGGHRYGPWLPWYRGDKNSPLEPETRAVVDFFKKELFQARILQSVDIHSGFGRLDRLWYPYAKTKGAFPERANVRKVSRLLKRTYPYNVYRVERQSKIYTTHGDLWDYLFDEYQAVNQKKEEHPAVFLPWTLELGSWAWVRKNPKQIFSALGGFNPMLPHRYKRIMRRHGSLLEFLFRSTCEWKSWA